MKQFVNMLAAAVRQASQFTYVVGVTAILLMMAHITIHVFFQYVFGYPLPGTMLFVSNYYMVIVTFLCLAAVQIRNGHISVDVFVHLLSARAQRVLTGLSSLLSTVIFSLLAWQGFLVAESRRVSGAFEIEYDIKFLIWPTFYVVPVGAGLMALVCAVQLLALILDEPMTAEENNTQNFE